MIANDVPNDPRSNGVPAGHPAIKSFLGVPILHKERLIGSFGLANRPDGYHPEIVDELHPLISTLSVIIMALKLTVERKRSEALLKESEERCRAIIQNSGDGIALLGGEPIRLKYVNQAMSDIFGYTSEEFYSMSIDTFMDTLVPEHRTIAVERMQNRLSGKDVANGFEYQIIRKNGDIGWIELYADSVTIGGERSTLAGYRDITEKKVKEKEILKKQMELEKNTKKLEEMNTALKVLIDHHREELDNFKNGVIRKFEKIVIPYFSTSPEMQSREQLSTTMAIIENHIKEILFNDKSNMIKHPDLSPTESRVAFMIRSGKSSKEIASSLNMSLRTVYFHRENIRKKLNLSKLKTNLRTYLQSSYL